MIAKFLEDGPCDKAAQASSSVQCLELLFTLSANTTRSELFINLCFPSLFQQVLRQELKEKEVIYSSFQFYTFVHSQDCLSSNLSQSLASQQNT